MQDVVSEANRPAQSGIRGIPNWKFADPGRERCGEHATGVLTGTLRVQPKPVQQRRPKNDPRTL